ncbi:hypothetical protein PFC51_19360 [Paracoccus pantotrophus]|nr:hypothetical protein [Paracoccus pantotrophus]MDF3856413.1 hypothetical protein [Paracoccus pantotrophus]
MFSRNARLEGDAIGLGGGVAVAMLGEVKPLLFRQRGAQVARLADQPGLAFLADAAAKHGLDEDQPMPVDQRLDVVLGRIRAKHFGRRETDMSQQTRTREHSGHLHEVPPVILNCLGRGIRKRGPKAALQEFRRR